MTHPRSPLPSPTLALTLVLPLLLSACGGSGGSGAAPTYSVGGSLSGLAAAGLSLANGADITSPAANAASFTFPTPLASGTSYAVTVSAQPTGETCNVASGTGTVASANVTSVAVTCAANTYFIGGTITGLTASGLTLANGGDTVSPAANATSFAFPTHLTAGSPYSASVSHQPAGLNCLLANPSGTVAGNVSTISVSCTALPSAQWSAPTTVGTGAYPLLAGDPSGVAFFVAWCGCTGTGAVGDATAPSLASRFTDAGGWSAPAAMAATGGTPLLGLQFDAQGRGFAVWEAPTGIGDGSVNAMFSRYLPGSGWGYGAMPFAVPLPPVVAPPGALLYTSLRPLGLSVGSDGSAIALVWEDVRITASAAINPWYLAALVGGAAAGADVLQIGAESSLLPTSDSSPAILLDSNGQPVPYYAHQTFWPFDPITPSSMAGRYAALYSSVTQVPVTLSNGNPGIDTVTATGLAVSTGVGSGATMTLATRDLLANNIGRVGVNKASTAFAPNGDAIVTWSVIAGNAASVTFYAQRFTGNTWLSAQTLYTSTGQVADYSAFTFLPVAGMDGAGNAMLAFEVFGSLQVVKMDAATGTFSAATQVATVGGGANTASLQMDTAGNAFLLDYDQRQGTVRRYDASTGTWGAPGLTFGTASGQTPVLALDTSGNAMVVWMAGGAILASRYH